MYAIKIITSNNDTVESVTSTVFYLAEEVSYTINHYASTADFWAQVEQHNPSYQLGSSPKTDSKEEGNYMSLCIYKDSDIVKEIFIMPWAWVYIMVDGKTIEVIKVK
jgi:hypothetical protein